MGRIVLHCLVLYIGALVVRTAADGVLSFKLLHFENPKGKKLDGECCDGYNHGTSRCYHCDTAFKICASSTASRPCSIVNVQTDIISSADTFTFESYFYTYPGYWERTNPLTQAVLSWNASLFIKITAFDRDSLRMELICNMATYRQINATRFGVKETTKLSMEGEIRDGVIPKLTVEISVACKKEYLIPSCSEHCVDTDDATGHYVCDYDKGIRKCLAGWHGNRCLVHCIPRNDSRGHYMCDRKTGAKICLEGWENVAKNCTEAITIKPSSTSTIILSISTSTPLFLHDNPSSFLSEHHSSSSLAKESSTTKYIKKTGIFSSERTYKRSSVENIKSTLTIKATRSSSLVANQLKSTVGRVTERLATTAAIHSTGSLDRIVLLTATLKETQKTASMEKDRCTQARGISNDSLVRTGNPVRSANSAVASTRLSCPDAVSYSSTVEQPTSAVKIIPTTEATTRIPRKEKGFEFSKLFAAGVSFLFLVVMLATIVTLWVRKERAQRVQPIRPSDRCKKSSAPLNTSSLKPYSIGSSPAFYTAPLGGGIVETNIDNLPCLTNSNNDASGKSMRGFSEPRQPQIRLSRQEEVSQGMADSWEMSQNTHTRQSGERNDRDGSRFDHGIPSYDPYQEMIQKQKFILVPIPTGHKVSL